MRIKFIIILSFSLTLFSGCLAKETMNSVSPNVDNLKGKNLFCEDYYSYVTYSFLDHKRYQINYYFLRNFEIGERKGIYGVLDDVRYFYLKSDHNLIVYYKLEIKKNKNNWQKKKLKTPKENYYLDRQKVNIVFSPNRNSEIVHKCKIFNGTSEELDESTLAKYFKYIEDLENKEIHEKIKQNDQQRKKNKI